MTSPTRSPKDKELRTQQILEAAEAVWLEHGLAGGTIDMIATKVGLGKGTLYLYWMSQRELMEAVRARLRKRTGLLTVDLPQRAREVALLLELELVLDREGLVVGLARAGVTTDLISALEGAR